RLRATSWPTAFSPPWIRVYPTSGSRSPCARRARRCPAWCSGDRGVASSSRRISWPRTGDTTAGWCPVCRYRRWTSDGGGRPLWLSRGGAAGRRSGAVVGMAAPPKNPVLLKQVLDDRLLSIDPTGEHQAEEGERRRQRIHRESVPEGLPRFKDSLSSGSF